MSLTVPDPAAAPLSFRLFGPFQIRRHGELLPGLRARKGHWLLTLLALRHGGPVERAWLAGTLWPDSPEPLAFRSLRSSLSDLRLALGPDAGRLRSPTTHTLALDLSGTEVDLLAFDAAIARGDLAALAEAVALYRGPLLEECAEGWVLAERQAREEAYLMAQERLAAEALRMGEAGAAERYLRMAVSVDPLRESAQRALMQALAAGGNYGAAFLAYRELRLRLHRELNTEPDAATGRLFQQLQAEAREGAASGKARGAPTTRGSTERAVPPDLPVDAAPRRSREAAPHTLPLPLTRFIGRAEQMAEVEQALAAHRLVTLTGAGGCGKTRLALQVATRVLDRYPEGVWWVELAPLADPARVPQTVATALGLRELPGHPITRTLAEYLRPQEALLVLDNCEHLVTACAHLVEALLRSCPNLRLLTTSREALAVGGEMAYRVPPLSLPDAQRRLGLEELTQSEAVRLFVERATMAQPAFRMTEANAPVVAELCRRLDGLPLAIELAAARVNVLSVEQFAARMEDLLRLLTRSRRTALPHQQSLRATLDWSYALLSDPERALLRRLSVFAGGSTLEAAEAVGADDYPVSPSQKAVVRPADVLDLLTGLVEKSMVVAEPAACGSGPDTEVRYRLLETVRQYAQERLVEAGEVEAVHGRHRDWFLALAEETEAAVNGPAASEWLERMEQEHDHLRGALAWSEAQGQAEAGLRLGVALWDFWGVRGYFREGREHLAALLALPGAEARTPVRAKALHVAGRLAWQQGDCGAARALLGENLAIFRELGDMCGIAQALGGLGWVAREEGDHAAGRALDEESLTIYRELGHKGSIAWSLIRLGIGAREQGDYERARALDQESLPLFREVGNKRGIAWALSGLGIAARVHGEYGAAGALLGESLAIFRELGDKPGIIMDLEGLAAVAVVQARSRRAARLLGAAEALGEVIGAPLPPAERAEHDRSVAAVRAALSEEAFSAAWAAGRAMSLEDAVALALDETCEG